jgi:asparagine synthase (glutamine-hydrolysing)
LYYHHKDGNLRFASEIKALIQDPSLSRQMNLQSLGFFFSFLYVPAPLSIFEGINKLPAAHSLTFKDGKVKIEKYWNLSFGSQKITKLSGFQYAGLIRQNLQDSVERRLVSDVPLGVFLSGGIDSSAVVAMMRRATRGPIKTFSIGYSDKYSSFNELESAKYIAEHFSTEHQTFIVEPKIIEMLPKVVWHLDEPFADSSAVLNFLISQEARRVVTVALTGIGGDEVFSGYPRYLGARLSLGYEKLPYFLRRLIAKAADDFIKEDLTSQNKGGRLKRFLKGCLLNREERYIWWMQFFDKQALNDLFDLSNPALGLFDPFRMHKNYFYGVDTNDYLDQIFYTDINTYLSDDLLFMADRMSMANSLEVRVPFCDHKLIELSASIASRTKMSGFRLKGLFKDSLIATLPANVLNKPKQGFMVPVGRWIKEDLRDYTQDLLSQESLKKISVLNYHSVRSILDEHFKGRRNHTHKIWALLIFKLWHDLYVRKT